ncbi:uncharacterized protein PAC_12843 [Phialocephala subalpina]|uniref:Zn(2)-C6 fungal-type domain-containing protein n=1 Tax=Phialocephala subalpina TaxID=576137 RepID=A0A1L7XD81_9HELO|nr:uncharacterized protein PAC_12843 [Phialocephala subalpina]
MTAQAVPDAGAAAVEKRTRSSGPRSRSGCHTCKIRRVKCDERRPGCLRCEKFGRECDGYEPQKTPLRLEKAPKSISKIHSLLPIALAPATSVSHVQITVQCHDEQEEQYLRFFHVETAGVLSGGFDSSLWNHIVLQACNEEPCILHIAVALAALDKSCRAKSMKCPLLTSEEHRRYALQKYSTAIQEVREVLRDRRDSLRTVLIASLLIFCFESFHGDIRLALTNVHMAVELMYAWLSDLHGVAIAPGHFSPAPHIIEDDLVSAYTRMDVHLMSWIDAPLPSRAKILSYFPTEAFDLRPSFSTLTGAKTAFDHVTNHAFQYLGSVQNIKAHSSNESSPLSETSENSTTEEVMVLKELRQWMKALDAILNRARTYDTHEDYVGATILRIHAVTVELCIRAALFESHKPHAYDSFLPEFCELVALCSALVKHPRFVKSFVFNVGFVPSLFILVTKCRDRMVRQEAIDVLKAAHPRREGVWDCLMVARIGEELIKSEEEAQLSGRTKEMIEIHLACLNMPFELPRPPRTLQDIEMKRDRRGGRGYLLDWVERCVDMNAVADNHDHRPGI